MQVQYMRTYQSVYLIVHCLPPDTDDFDEVRLKRTNQNVFMTMGTAVYIIRKVFGKKLYYNLYIVKIYSSMCVCLFVCWRIAKKDLTKCQPNFSESVVV